MGPLGSPPKNARQAGFFAGLATAGWAIRERLVGRDAPSSPTAGHFDAIPASGSTDTRRRVFPIGRPPEPPDSDGPGQGRNRDRILDHGVRAMAGATTVRSAGMWHTATTRTIGVLVLALASVPAWAGMQWHADLAAARAASAASRRPVLAVFTASWSPESTSFEQQVLVAEEVEAVLAACFEAVRIDVDQRPGITKRIQVGARALGMRAGRRR